VAIFLKSGSLNLLELSGPVKACNGITLPFTVMNWNELFLHPFQPPSDALNFQETHNFCDAWAESKSKIEFERKIREDVQLCISVSYNSSF
jgi:hypothetical protein